MGGAAHRDGDRAGRALRRRGRRVPDPRPQRLRRPGVRAWVLAIGAARYLFLLGEWLLPWMRAPLPPRRWRKVVAAVQGVVLTVAAADVLPRAHAGAPGSSRSARSRRRSASACGGCGAVGTRPQPAPRARRGRCARASPSRSRSSPCCSSGPRSSRRTSRARHPRRVRAAPARAARRRRLGRRAARQRRAACWPWSSEPCWRAPGRAGPRHGVLRGVRPAVRPRRRLSHGRIGVETLRDTIGRSTGPHPRRRHRRARRRAPRRPGRALLRVDAGRRRPPRLGAARGRGARRRLGRAARLGAPVASTSAAALAVREVQAVRTGLQGARTPRPRDRPRPLPRHARQPAADRPARQGRPAAVRRELREGRGPGLVLLAAGRRRARPGHRAAAGRRLLLAQRLPHLADLRRHQLAGALDPADGGADRHPARATTSSSRATASPSAGRSSAPAGGRSATCRRTSGRGSRARPSTTTTSSTTAATSATAARASASRRCPTSTRCRRCSGNELAKRDRPPVFAEVDFLSSHMPWTRIPRLVSLGQARRRLGLTASRSEAATRSRDVR